MNPRYEPSQLAFAGVTDCYQPAERTFRITRQCLEVLKEFCNPLSVITKNHLVTRDADVLADLARATSARSRSSRSRRSMQRSAQRWSRAQRPGQTARCDPHAVAQEFQRASWSRR